MDKKYQIFVSSPQRDLRDERDAVVKAILRLGNIPVGMEMFNAADESSWKLITRYIDESDFYLVILAHRYGSMDGEVSFTEKEYDYAVMKNVPTFGFLIHESAPWPSDRADHDETARRKLREFKKKVGSKQVSYWENADVLGASVISCLATQIPLASRPGWVRGSSVPGPAVAEEISRLSRENAELRKQLKDSSSPDFAFDLVAAKLNVCTEGTFNDGVVACLEATFSIQPRNGASAGFVIKRQISTISCVNGSLALVGGKVVAASGGCATDDMQLIVTGTGGYRLSSITRVHPAIELFEAKILKCSWEFRPVGYDIAYLVEATLGNRTAANRKVTWSLT